VRARVPAAREKGSGLMRVSGERRAERESMVER
jgi:hypothetical protein